MNKLTWPILTKYRSPILMASLAVGSLSIFYKDLILIPTFGIIFFFLPTIVREDNSDEPIFLRPARMLLPILSLEAFVFTSKFANDFVLGKPVEFKDIINISLLCLCLNLMFFLLLLGCRYLWKRVLKFDGIHFRILVNQFSLPILSLTVLTVGLLFYVINNPETQVRDFQWYYLFVIPVALMIPWGIHMFGLTKAAKEKGWKIYEFLYEYERCRFESHDEFRSMQVHSTKFIGAVILLPLMLLCLYQGIKEKNFETSAVALVLFAVVLFSLYKKIKNKSGD